MTYRVLPLFVAVLALALLAGTPALAQDREGTHEGTVVKASDGKLTMTDRDGKKEHSHDVPRDAKITCDGKDCKLEDLKSGYQVKVTMEKKDNKLQVTKIEAKKESK